MTMLLGGRAAEQLVFGAITTGASDDLERVAEIARAMVHEYAMGTGMTSLRADRRGRRRVTRRRLDDEVRELADEAFRARYARSSTPTAPQLDELASTLLSNEVLERADIDVIMGDVAGRGAAPHRASCGGGGDGGQPGPPARPPLSARQPGAGANRGAESLAVSWRADAHHH